MNVVYIYVLHDITNHILYEFENHTRSRYIDLNFSTGQVIMNGGYPLRNSFIICNEFDYNP